MPSPDPATPPPIHIDNPADPRLADYANLKDAVLRDEEFRGVRGRFIAESELVVRTLIDSPFSVHSVLIEASCLDRLADAFARLPAATPVFTAPRRVLESVTGFAFHRGVLACGSRGEPTDWRKVAAGARLLVIAERIANADNIGAIFRNTACLAGTDAAVLLTPECCDPFYRKALRVSIGHCLRLPFATIDGWPGSLADLHAAGFVSVALTPGKGSVDLHNWAANARNDPQRLALLVGAEGPGLSPETLGDAKERVRIPMAQGADSLNVATALAVVLSRVQR